MPAVLERPAILAQPAPAVAVRPMPQRHRVPHDDAGIDFRPVPVTPAETVDARERGPGENLITDAEELGRLITTSAVSAVPSSFAIGCRSALQVTRFATPMRGLMLTLGSAFDSTSATVSPSLLLHTFPAMEAMVGALRESGANLPWHPDGERSIGLGSARHLFISHDMPVPDDARGCQPDTLLEVVGAHLIPASWFDSVVAPKCDMDKLTVVYYGMVGIEGSLFEREWSNCDTRGLLHSRS